MLKRRAGDRWFDEPVEVDRLARAIIPLERDDASRRCAALLLGGIAHDERRGLIGSAKKDSLLLDLAEA